MQKNTRTKVGLALSGGGARGLAHIGVLKIFEREGLQVDILAGTSMGGLIAAVYAAGLESDLLEQESIRMSTYRNLLPLVDLSVNRRGLLEGQRVYGYLEKFLGELTFADLRLPVALVAVDLNSGQRVILRSGRVLDAVRATIALPGVFTPVEREGQMLVDGGLLDNLPVDVVRQMGANVVIGVDISSRTSTSAMAMRRGHDIPSGLSSAAEVLWRSLDVMAADINNRRLAEGSPDVLIRPPLSPDMSTFKGFTRAPEIIAAGEKAALETLPDIRRMISQRHSD